MLLGLPRVGRYINQNHCLLCSAINLQTLHHKEAYHRREPIVCLTGKSFIYTCHQSSMSGACHVLKDKNGHAGYAKMNNPANSLAYSMQMSENLKTNMNIHENRHLSDSKLTPDIEKKYVHQVYDAIAPHFSSTRFAKWPKVADFLNSLEPNSIVVDAGCGNGKYLDFNPHCFFIGCDVSAPLISICAKKGHEVVVADALNLPYRSGFGDAAISIAVLHHLSTESRRKKAIEELMRVVREGGLVLITVWAVEQEDKSLLTKWTPLVHKYEDEWVGPGTPRQSSHSTVTLKSIPEIDDNSCHQPDLQSNLKIREPWTVMGYKACAKTEDDSLSSSISESAADHHEYFVPWHLPYYRAETSGVCASAIANGLARNDDKKGAVVYNRYYHVFAEGELERLVSGIGNAVIRDKFYDKSNWCVILEKTSAS